MTGHAAHSGRTRRASQRLPVNRVALSVRLTAGSIAHTTEVVAMNYTLKPLTFRSTDDIYEWNVLENVLNCQGVA